MDISAIEGEELRTVAFVEDYLELRFGDPVLTLYAWPFVMHTEYSVAIGEPVRGQDDLFGRNQG